MKGQKHITDILFTLALFCVFAGASLIVVFIGADVYSGTVRRMDNSFEINTTLAFVSTKIQQHDIIDAINIKYIDDVPAIVLESQIGERIFETWIYHYEYALWEIFIAQDFSSSIVLGDGQLLVHVHSFNFSSIDDGLISLAAATADGFSGRRLIDLRTGR